MIYLPYNIYEQAIYICVSIIYDIVIAMYFYSYFLIIDDALDISF